MKKLILPVFYFVLIVSGVAYAGNEDAHKADSAKANPLTISGHVHGYYNYNLADPGTPSAISERLYTGEHNSFTMALSQISASYSTDKVDIFVDLNFGPYAGAVNGGGSADPTTLALQNAYGVYKFSDKFTVEFGKFGTHIGYEIIDATANPNYSYSYLFRYGPFYNIGARARYELNDQLGFMLGVVNNWDAYQENNASKSIVATVRVSPFDGLDAYFNYVGGNENVLNNDFVQEFDLTAGYAATDALSLGLNVAYRSAKPDVGDAVSWFGTAFYAGYAITEKIGANFRFEHFNDGDAYAGIYANPTDGKGTSINAVTLTGDFKIGEHASIKPEFRIDMAADDMFVDGDGKATGSQTTIGSAFLFYF